MKKYLTAGICAALLTALLAGAAGCGSTLSYNDYSDAAQGYDKTLFYQNMGDVQGADPCVITVGDTFYLYVTNAGTDPACTVIRGWRSKNLSDWEALGPVFVPARDAWAVNNLWSPEVVAVDGKYYMYYSGYDISTQDMGIGVAVSDSPAGGFHELEGQFGGKTVSRNRVPFDFGCPAIDPHPFVDDDGSVYLYFSRDQVDKQSCVMGCKLEKDMVTVAEGSLTETPLLQPSQTWENPQITPSWNEAPNMVKHEGKYYLTYSGNYYHNRIYAVGVAVGDSPLGTFVKADYNPILAADPEWTFVSGTGHASLFPSPDGTELWMAYHSHIDVEQGGAERKIVFDRVVFDGDRMFVCGPSVTPQALPSGCSVYRNFAPSAQVSTDGQGGADLLNDGVINYAYGDVAEREFRAEGKRTITLTFAEEIFVKAVMVYDSADYELSADTVNIGVGAERIEGLAFNSAYRYIDEYGFSMKIPGSAAIAEFAETAATTVTVEIPSGVSLTEIAVLARRADV